MSSYSTQEWLSIYYYFTLCVLIKVYIFSHRALLWSLHNLISRYLLIFIAYFIFPYILYLILLEHRNAILLTFCFKLIFFIWKFCSTLLFVLVDYLLILGFFLCIRSYSLDIVLVSSLLFKCLYLISFSFFIILVRISLHCCVQQ